MSPESNYTQATQQLSSLPDVVHKEEALDVTDDRTRTRHPRWTRQDTFVLIHAKKVVENRAQKGCGSTSVWGSDQFEPKWDSVSSYCKRHCVNREPVQCRKRWSNLLGDFKKIKAWESQKRDESESFWLMRNELRRERKLPSFFDREVYNVLDGLAFATEAIPLAHITFMAEMNNIDGCEPATAEEDEEEEQGETQTVCGGQHVTANGYCEQSGQDEICWSSKKETISSENSGKTHANPMPISAMKSFCQGYTNPGITKEKNTGSNKWAGSMSREGLKRRRLSSDECDDTNLCDQLIKVLEKNSSMLNAQLEAQKINCEVERGQREEYHESLVAALNKLTNAIGRIADKL